MLVVLYRLVEMYLVGKPASWPALVQYDGTEILRGPELLATEHLQSWNISGIDLNRAHFIVVMW